MGEDVKPWPLPIVGEKGEEYLIEGVDVLKTKPRRIRVKIKHKKNKDAKPAQEDIELTNVPPGPPDEPTWGPPVPDPGPTVTTTFIGQDYDPKTHHPGASAHFI